MPSDSQWKFTNVEHIDMTGEGHYGKIPAFDELPIGTVGFHHLFMCDLPVSLHVRIIFICFISSSLLYFGIATLQMELNAQRAGWEGGSQEELLCRLTEESGE